MKMLPQVNKEAVVLRPYQFFIAITLELYFTFLLKVFRLLTTQQTY